MLFSWQALKQQDYQRKQEYREVMDGLMVVELACQSNAQSRERCRRENVKTVLVYSPLDPVLTLNRDE